MVIAGMLAAAMMTAWGEKVGEAENMLIAHEFDVTDCIKTEVLHKLCELCWVSIKVLEETSSCFHSVCRADVGAKPIMVVDQWLTFP